MNWRGLTTYNWWLIAAGVCRTSYPASSLTPKSASSFPNAAELVRAASNPPSASKTARRTDSCPVKMSNGDREDLTPVDALHRATLCGRKPSGEAG